MARYTVLLKDIIFSLTGVTKESEAIEQARSSIFDFSYPIYDVKHKAELERKILKHYYMQEIGQETYGLWKHFLDMTMNEIMPFFNQKYEAVAKEYDWLLEDDHTRTKDINSTDTTKGKTSSTIENTGTITKSYTKDDQRRFSDTPQNGLSGVLNDKYLTEYERTTGLDSDKQTNALSNTMSGNNETAMIGSSRETETYKGRSSSGSKLLQERLGVIQNIDMEVIKALSDLFMCLW